MKEAETEQKKIRASKKKFKMEDSTNNNNNSQLRSETKDFLHTIYKYLDCRGN
jgi:hypothetical protein